MAALEAKLLLILVMAEALLGLKLAHILVVCRMVGCRLENAGQVAQHVLPLHSLVLVGQRLLHAVLQ